MKLEDHPTVRHFPELERTEAISEPRPFGAGESTAFALECGADDVGLIGIDRAELEPQRDKILRHYPWTRSLLSIIVKMGQAPVRETPQSGANLEFHQAGHETNEVCAGIVARLPDRASVP